MTPQERVAECRRRIADIRATLVVVRRNGRGWDYWTDELEDALMDLERAEAAEIAAEWVA